jgi:hypothetical protein
VPHPKQQHHREITLYYNDRIGKWENVDTENRRKEGIMLPLTPITVEENGAHMPYTYNAQIISFFLFLCPYRAY